MISEENLGGQFDDIIGRNFNRKETAKAENRARLGAFHDENAPDEVDQNLEGLSRMADFPSHMITTSEHGEFQVQHQSPRGWTHTWSGGPYIEHSNDKAGVVDITNMQDFSLPRDQQPYQKGLSHADFMSHVNNFEKHAEDNYPKDYLP
jgi:hypothetical protein